MPARSSYLSAQQSSVDEELERLVRATLREHATPENTRLAKEWIHRLLPEHRFPHTAAAEVGRSVAALLEKLRAHSQLEAADYLEDRHAAFMRCRLSRRHTLDAQPAVLQSPLLLARQPTRVPLRTVRSLRDVAEARKARLAERCREAFEGAHAYRALLEAELQGAAEDDSTEWEAAWAEPDQVPEDGPAVDGPTAGPATAAPRPALARQLPSSVWPASARPPGSPSSSGSSRSSSSAEAPLATSPPAQPRGARPPPLPLLQPPSCEAPARGEGAGLGGPLAARGSRAPSWPLPQARPPGSAPTVGLPRGALPAPPWASPVAAAGGKAARAAAASEQAVVEAALQMLAGRLGGLVRSAAGDGSLAWLPATPGHLSSGALASVLRRLTELGSALCRLRSLAAVLQASAPPLADAQLCGELAREVAEGRLGLALVARIGWLGTGPRARSAAAARVPEEVPVVFGLCWQSLGEALAKLLAELAAEAQALQARLYHAELAADSAKHLDAPLTLLQVEKWVEPRRRPVVGVHGVLDGALRGVATRCQGRDPREWPELASEELLTHLARALRSDSLCGGASEWMTRLWRGAMRPLLEAMDLWSRTGQLRDPCGEFRAACGHSAGAAVPALLPQGVFAAGRLVSLLRDWVPLPDQAAQEGCTDAAAGFFDLCKALPEETTSQSHRRFVPLEAAVQAAVLRPALVGSREAERPLLLRLLLDDDRGLLSHLAAVRLVCFLERGAAVAPLVRLLLRHTRTGGRASRAGPSAVELGAALADGLEPSRDGCPPSSAQRLCLEHLSLARGGSGGGGGGGGGVGMPRDPCEWLNGLWARYAAPAPLGRVLGEEALRVYSCVMALLLRVRLAQEALLEVQRLPLLGFRGRRGREARERGEDSVQLAGLAHSADLLRAELAHFAGCLDRYLRVEVIQRSCRAFDAELRRLACRDFDSAGEPGAGPVDAVELMAQLHREHLRRLQQHCFLAPETQAVLADVEYLLGLAFELRGTLAALLPGAEDPEGVDEVAADSPMGLDDRFAAFAGLSAAALKVASVRQELQSSVKYLLQVLRVSIAQGPRHPVLSLCLHLNFNGFYHGEET